MLTYKVTEKHTAPDGAVYYRLECTDFDEEVPDTIVDVDDILKLFYHSIKDKTLIFASEKSSDAFKWRSYTVASNGDLYTVIRDGKSITDGFPHGTRYQTNSFYKKKEKKVTVHILGRPKVVPLIFEPYHTCNATTYYLTVGDKYADYKLEFFDDRVDLKDATPVCTFMIHTQVVEDTPSLARASSFKEGFGGSPKMSIVHSCSVDAARAWVQTLYDGDLKLTWETISDVYSLCDRFLTFDKIDPVIAICVLFDLIKEKDAAARSHEFDRSVWLKFIEQFVKRVPQRANHRVVCPLFTKAFDKHTYLRALRECPDLFATAVEIL